MSTAGSGSMATKWAKSSGTNSIKSFCPRHTKSIKNFLSYVDKVDKLSSLSLTVNVERSVGVEGSPTRLLPLTLTKGNFKKEGFSEVKRLKIEFFIPMAKVPTTTHQMKQVHVVNGKPVFYEPEELKAAKVKLRDHLAAHVPEKQYSGAVRLVVKWCFPITGKHVDGEYKATKPDTDNLQKLLKDVMTGLHYWKDDALVASEIIEKFWAARPGLYIAIEPIGR